MRPGSRAAPTAPTTSRRGKLLTAPRNLSPSFILASSCFVNPSVVRSVCMRPPDCPAPPQPISARIVARRRLIARLQLWPFLLRPFRPASSPGAAAARVVNHLNAAPLSSSGSVAHSLHEVSRRRGASCSPRGNRPGNALTNGCLPVRRQVWRCCRAAAGRTSGTGGPGAEGCGSPPENLLPT
jgi:hypothetical protein